MNPIDAGIRDLALREHDLARRMEELTASRPGFWRPIVTRWLVWLGGSLSVGVTMVLVSVAGKMLKAVFK